MAGGGVVPGLLADSLGPRAVLIALKGFASAAVRARAQAEIQLGHFGAMIALGHEQGAEGVLFIGGLDRPNADGFALDDYTRQHMDLSSLQAGDDAVLRAISDLFLRGGLETVGALDVAPELAMPLGTITQAAPPQAAARDQDVRRGLQVARALGALDIGQAVVVQQGLVLAVEGIEGTDALIARSAPLARPGQAPILVKIAKPQQDMRLDIPTFGPQTVDGLARHGFGGAFLEAERTLIVDQTAVRAAADRADLFIEGIRF